MGKLANKYTNPDTGETYTTKVWCQLLGISDVSLKRRIERHGVTGMAFVKNMRTDSRDKKWSDFDRKFLIDCHHDPRWRLSDIAKKLEKSTIDVQKELSSLGLINNSVRRPSVNWLLVWRMSNERLSNKAIARVLGVTPPTVGYAMKRMREMTDDERNEFFEGCGYL